MEPRVLHDCKLMDCLLTHALSLARKCNKLINDLPINLCKTYEIYTLETAVLFSVIPCFWFVFVCSVNMRTLCCVAGLFIR